MRSRFNNYILVKQFLLVAGVAAALYFSKVNSAADTLFSENFNGYTYFPDQIPSGDYVNKGIPQISEGASAFWYAARFEDASSGNSSASSIDDDLAIQKFGSSAPNNNPCGRFEDDAGIVLRIDTTGYQNVNLSFIWRTFQAETSDRYVVGYHVGDTLGFDTGANRYRDLRTGSGSWATGWTELMRETSSNSFQSENFALPDNAGPIYVAFWLDNGEGDYGKLDNVLISASPILIPEPTTLSLGLIGIIALVTRRKFQL